MSFYHVLGRYRWEDVSREIRSTSKWDVERALGTEHLTLRDFAAFLSPAAESYLELMARRAHQVTEQRFGKVISLFAPLYLSNVCTNRCVYCGFNVGNQVNRVTLTPEQALVEGRYLRDQGFQHLLLVSGEAPKVVTMAYFAGVLEKLRPLFASISVETYPMDTQSYGQLIANGVDGLVIYQETYSEKRYKEVHLGGRKRNYRWRLDTPERGGQAGFRRIGIGALLGLNDWRVEGFFLACHARYLLQKFWRSHITVSFPRIRLAAGSYRPPCPVSDAHFVQLLTALRILLPDVGLVLSTREPPDLRDHLIPLGITSMSAGSRTDPGGYAQESEAEAQFEIADHRSPRTVAGVICQKGYEPVWKDWDSAFLS